MWPLLKNYLNYKLFTLHACVFFITLSSTTSCKISCTKYHEGHMPIFTLQVKGLEKGAFINNSNKVKVIIIKNGSQLAAEDATQLAIHVVGTPEDATGATIKDTNENVIQFAPTDIKDDGTLEKEIEVSPGTTETTLTLQLKYADEDMDTAQTIICKAITTASYQLTLSSPTIDDGNTIFTIFIKRNSGEALQERDLEKLQLHIERTHGKSATIGDIAKGNLPLSGQALHISTDKRYAYRELTIIPNTDKKATFELQLVDAKGEIIANTQQILTWGNGASLEVEATMNNGHLGAAVTNIGKKMLPANEATLSWNTDNPHHTIHGKQKHTITISREILAGKTAYIPLGKVHLGDPTSTSKIKLILSWQQLTAPIEIELRLKGNKHISKADNKATLDESGKIEKKSKDKEPRTTKITEKETTSTKAINKEDSSTETAEVVNKVLTKALQTQATVEASLAKLQEEKKKIEEMQDAFNTKGEDTETNSIEQLVLFRKILKALDTAVKAANQAKAEAADAVKEAEEAVKALKIDTSKDYKTSHAAIEAARMATTKIKNMHQVLVKKFENKKDKKDDLIFQATAFQKKTESTLSKIKEALNNAYFITAQRKVDQLEQAAKTTEAIVGILEDIGIASEESYNALEATTKAAKEAKQIYKEKEAAYKNDSLLIQEAKHYLQKAQEILDGAIITARELANAGQPITGGDAYSIRLQINKAAQTTAKAEAMVKSLQELEIIDNKAKTHEAVQVAEEAKRLAETAKDALDKLGIYEPSEE